MPVTCGVPRGSMLGPLLFLCYVNDMPMSVKCKLLLYADDSFLLVSDKNPKVVSETLTRELETCNEWLIYNRLSLHLGKTEAMPCGTKRKTNNRENIEVKCKDMTIEVVTEVKYLGVKIDETLTGEGIVDTAVRKCTGRIKFFVQTGRMLTNGNKKRPCSNRLFNVT